MLSTSFEFRSKISENSKVLFKATLALADGTVKDLVGDDFMMGSMSFSDAVSSSGSFDIGAAIINKLDFTLNNYDRRFDSYDFTGATVVPYIGVELDNGNVEWLMKGHYGVEQPESYGSTIGISALDNLRLLEVPYSEVATQYPASLRTIVMDVCRHCGVALLNADFANNGFVVPMRPDDDALTCLEVVGYAAQASGNYARCAVDGQLVIDWYDTSAYESEDWLDGDRFDDDSPYSSGSTADGGNFVNYNSGDTYDGGEFGSNAFARIYAYTSATVATDDVVITGVSVTAQDEVEEDGSSGADGETALSGSEGYVLAVEGNPFIQFGKAAAAAAQIGARVVGMRFRPFDVSAVGDPAVEAGDPVILTDHLQNQYTSYITRLTYRVGGYEAYACNAETPGRNTAASYRAATKAYVKSRNAVKREKKAREQALKKLAEELGMSSGLYMTQDVQLDGSTVYYMHDKPELRESQVVWKLTTNAFGISTDGGKTYPYGLDVNGDAILNRIYAIGLNADYLETGSLTVRDPENPENVLFSADIETGRVVIGGFSVSSASIYNDMLRLDGGGLSFRSEGQDVAALYSQLLVVDGNLHGILHVKAPSVLTVSTHYPYQGDSSLSPLLNYSKASDLLEIYSGSAKLDGVLEMGGNYIRDARFSVNRLIIDEGRTAVLDFTGVDGYVYTFTKGILTAKTWSGATGFTGTVEGKLPQSFKAGGAVESYLSIALKFTNGRLISAWPTS